MKNTSFLFFLIAMLQFTTYSVNSQVVFYAEKDFKGEQFKVSNESDKDVISVQNAESKIPWNINSLRIQSGYKLTIYANRGFTGDFVVYYSGEYANLPLELLGYYDNFFARKFIEGGPSLHQKIGSYRLEKVDGIQSTVILQYHLMRPYYKKTGSDHEMVYHYYLQNLGPGFYRSTDPSNNVESIGHGIIYNVNTFLGTIIVPRGLLVTIKTWDDKQLQLPLPGDTDKKMYYNLSDFPDFYKEKSLSIEIKPALSKLKKVELEVTSREKKAQETLAASIKYVNDQDENDPNPTYGAGLTYSESRSITNEWSKTDGRSVAAGLAVSVTAGVEVEMAPLGVGVNTSFSTTIEGSVSTAIENSVTKGESTTTEVTKELNANCSRTSCPANSTCSVKIVAEPEIVTYDAVSTFVLLDLDGKEVPGSEFKMESTLTINASVNAKCLTEIVPN
jgi:hypothetical protein